MLAYYQKNTSDSELENAFKIKYHSNKKHSLTLIIAYIVQSYQVEGFYTSIRLQLP